MACIFCDIISLKEPTVFHHKESDFVVFENNLNWFPIQLLLTPTTHMTQSELWSSDKLIKKMANHANEIGKTKCPDGYRILSNFGDHGMQSQQHAHIHVIGGKELGLYVSRKK